MALTILPHDSKSSRRRRVLVPIAIAIFVLIWAIGAVAFYCDCCASMDHNSKAHPHGVTECLYRGLQLFHFHDSHWPEHHGLGYDIARFAAAGYALGLPLVILGWFCRGGVRRWWHKRKWNRGFLVVVGDTEAAAMLAADIVRGGAQVVLVTNHDDREVPGVLAIDGSTREPAFWRDEVKISRAAGVIVMHEDDVENVRCSAIIEETLEHAGQKRSKPLPVHIHLRDIHLKKGLVSLLPAGVESGAVDRRYFSRYEIMARQLAREYPLPAALVENPQNALPEHYVIVGFGSMGQNVALKLVKMGQQVVRKGDSFSVCKPRVTVIDRRGSQVVAAFLHSHPGFTDTCHFEVKKFDVLDQEFLSLSFLRPEEAAARCSIIFCLEDETLSTTAILMLLDACEQPEKDVDGIYFHSPNTEGVGQLLNRRTHANSLPVTPFAPDSHVFTADIVLNQSLDTMADVVHSAYLGVTTKVRDPRNISPAASQTWQNLSPQDKDSNREAADHLWAKVRTLGYELTQVPYGKWRGPTPPDHSKDLADAIAQNIEILASAEHYRWMAWRLIHGWKYGPQRDNTLKLHPLLVPYELLPDPEKEKDRVIVRLIPDLMRAGCLIASRI